MCTSKAVVNSSGVIGIPLVAAIIPAPPLLQSGAGIADFMRAVL